MPRLGLVFGVACDNLWRHSAGWHTLPPSQYTYKKQSVMVYGAPKHCPNHARNPRTLDLVTTAHGPADFTLLSAAQTLGGSCWAALQQKESSPLIPHSYACLSPHRSTRKQAQAGSAATGPYPRCTASFIRKPCAACCRVGAACGQGHRACCWCTTAPGTPQQGKGGREEEEFT